MGENGQCGREVSGVGKKGRQEQGGEERDLRAIICEGLELVDSSQPDGLQKVRLQLPLL